jgi:hypothetical protein
VAAVAVRWDDGLGCCEAVTGTTLGWAGADEGCEVDAATALRADAGVPAG